MQCVLSSFKFCRIVSPVSLQYFGLCPNIFCLICFRIALCFVSSIYCIVMAFLLLLLLGHQCWLITLGMTGQEWRCVQGHTWCAALWSDRPHSHGVLKNWRDFISCHKPLREGQGRVKEGLINSVQSVDSSCQYSFMLMLDCSSILIPASRRDKDGKSASFACYCLLVMVVIFTSSAYLINSLITVCERIM